MELRAVVRPYRDHGRSLVANFKMRESTVTALLVAAALALGACSSAAPREMPSGPPGPSGIVSVPAIEVDAACARLLELVSVLYGHQDAPSPLSERHLRAIARTLARVGASASERTFGDILTTLSEMTVGAIKNRRTAQLIPVAAAVMDGLCT